MVNSVSPAHCPLGARLSLVLALSTATTAGCGGGAASVAPVTPATIAPAPRPPSPAPDAVWLELKPEEREQHWSLLGGDEKVLCELPCGHWVSPGSAFVEYAKPGSNRVTRVDLPSDLGPAGGSEVAVARLGKPTLPLGNKLILSGISLEILGLILFVALDNLGGDTSALAVSVALGLGAPFLGAGIYLRVTSRPPDVLVKSASSDVPRTTFALGPGFVEATSSTPGGLHLVLTPLGAVGTF